MAEFILALRITLITLMAAAAIYIIIIVLKQQGNSDGTAAFGGGSSQSESESFYGKNKSKRVESKQKLYTIISGAVLAVSSIVFFILDTLVV